MTKTEGQKEIIYLATPRHTGPNFERPIDSQFTSSNYVLKTRSVSDDPIEQVKSPTPVPRSGGRTTVKVQSSSKFKCILACFGCLMMRK
jgi:hypothetical protein